VSSDADEILRTTAIIFFLIGVCVRKLYACSESAVTWDKQLGNYVDSSSNILENGSDIHALWHFIAFPYTQRNTTPVNFTPE